MLRLHLLQHWFNLSDPAAEEALYESVSMRQFVGIDLGREPVPDETTILNFRHLLERHRLGDAATMGELRSCQSVHGSASAATRLTDVLCPVDSAAASNTANSAIGISARGMYPASRVSARPLSRPSQPHPFGIGLFRGSLMSVMADWGRLDSPTGGQRSVHGTVQ
jgi:hypothetical protein